MTYRDFRGLVVIHMIAALVLIIVACPAPVSAYWGFLFFLIWMILGVAVEDDRRPLRDCFRWPWH